MGAQKLVPYQQTYKTLLNGYTKVGDFERGEKLLKEMASKGFTSERTIRQQLRNAGKRDAEEKSDEIPLVVDDDDDIDVDDEESPAYVEKTPPADFPKNLDSFIQPFALQERTGCNDEDTSPATTAASPPTSPGTLLQKTVKSSNN